MKMMTQRHLHWRSRCRWPMCLNLQMLRLQMRLLLRLQMRLQMLLLQTTRKTVMTVMAARQRQEAARQHPLKMFVHACLLSRSWNELATPR